MRILRDKKMSSPQNFQPKSSIFKKSSLWFLAAGVALGGIAVATVHEFPFAPAVYAQNQTNSRLAGIINPSSLATLKALDEARMQLAQVVMPSVVLIKSSNSASDQGGFAPAVQGEGSGVIIRPNGYIITNDHVVNGFNNVTVELKDGRSFPGKVIRSDQSGDIAVVKIEATDLPSIPFANSNSVEPGESVMAVGAPFGLQNSVTFGHVSALHRSQRIPDGRAPLQERYYPDLIQTDAAINPGNSGGALVNMDGELVGINTAIASNDGASNGIGFAIPASEARLVSDLLIEKGAVVRGYFGVDPEPLTEYKASQLHVKTGAYLQEVISTGPAYAAGLRAGDVVTKIGNNDVQNYMSLRNAGLEFQPGQSVQVTYVRNGETKTATVVLTTQPKLPTVQQRSPQGNSMQNPFGNMPMPRGFNFQFGPNGDQQQPQSAPQNHSGPARLGANVAALTPDLRSQYGIPSNVDGVVVVSVEDGSVAARLGVQPGSVIKSFDGKSVSSPQDLIGAEKGIKWGETHSIWFQTWGSPGTYSERRMDFQF